MEELADYGNRIEDELLLHCQHEALMNLLPEKGGIIVNIKEEWIINILQTGRVLIHRDADGIVVGKGNTQALLHLPEGKIIENVAVDKK